MMVGCASELRQLAVVWRKSLDVIYFIYMLLISRAFKSTEFLAVI
jgi:hypothetical protein